MVHQEQSNAEVALWNILRVSPWSEQTLPPLALAYKHSTVESSENKIEIKRLHLILTAAAAADLPGARSFVPLLKRLVKDNYNQRHQVTLPHQYTDELLLWAYALNGKQHAMFWLSPASEETDPFSLVLQHWQSAVPVCADILPGMHFFDAWQIVSTMQIKSDNHADLDCFEGVLPLCEKTVHKWPLKLPKSTSLQHCLLNELSS